ncbi:helix-turn-helix transcriptional regulator [Streptomyces sp. ASQP_92]|uniref:helix-turn-helix domain-containing protein n=1 Tax=Streptomyces sp. ASQP_92 TaxID=2979116 RepID=UPI0021BE28E4|nr:helix-turn-helix transcriptional regulator [Streptomyces sp. ASQP_92]MCT9094339.1 helix-turn-helix transcriptional regulator [Streptomyces sp. ASQP_92]
MARPENPLPSTTSALGRLATYLRSERTRMGLTYTQLSERAELSPSTLQRAASGTTLPTLAVAVAFDQACGGKGEARDLWRAAQREQRRQLTGPRPTGPLLDLVSDLRDLSNALIELHDRNGAPSMRLMEQRAEAKASQHGPLSRSAAHRILRRRAVPRTQKQLHAFLTACQVADVERPKWVRAWLTAQRSHRPEPTHKSPYYAERKADAAVSLGGRGSAQWAAASFRAVGLEPLEAFHGFTAPWSFRCTRCNSVGRGRLSDLGRPTAGCQVCRRRREDENEQDMSADG